MNDSEREAVISRIAQAARNGLDSAGHATIRFDRSWVDLDVSPSGCPRPFALVPIGGHLKLRVEGEDGISDPADASAARFADDLAIGLPRLASASRKLSRRALEIRRAVYSHHQFCQTT